MSTARATAVALTWRFRPSVLRAAWWASQSTSRVRRQLVDGVIRPSVSAPPRLPASAGLGVDAAIKRRSATCLEGALVRQRWLVAQGDERDVVIGLPTVDFGTTPAHAWVDGLDPSGREAHVELYRIAAHG